MDSTIHHLLLAGTSLRPWDMADGPTNSELLRHCWFTAPHAYFPNSDLSKSLLTSSHAISTSTLCTGLCWWSFRRPALVPLVRDRAKRRSRREKISPVPPGQGTPYLCLMPYSNVLPQAPNKVLNARLADTPIIRTAAKSPVKTSETYDWNKLSLLRTLANWGH